MLSEMVKAFYNPKWSYASSGISLQLHSTLKTKESQSRDVLDTRIQVSIPGPIAPITDTGRPGEISPIALHVESANTQSSQSPISTQSDDRVGGSSKTIAGNNVEEWTNQDSEERRKVAGICVPRS